MSDNTSSISSEASTTFRTPWWHLFEASASSIRIAQPPRHDFDDFFHHFSGPQTSVNPERCSVFTLILLLWACHLRRSLWLRPRKRQARRGYCHPLHHQCHWLPQPARSPPLCKHGNIPNSDIVIVSFSLQVHFPLLTPFTPLSQRKAPSFSRRAAHLFHRLFGYVAPKVIKNTGYRDSHRCLVDRYDRFHTIEVMMSPYINSSSLRHFISLYFHSLLVISL